MYVSITFLENQVTITPFYDPMIAKVIAHGETREEAISKLHDALEELKVEGIKTNTPMLLQVLEDDVFKSGIYTTGFVTKQLVKK